VKKERKCALKGHIESSEQCVKEEVLFIFKAPMKL